MSLRVYNAPEAAANVLQCKQAEGQCQEGTAGHMPEYMCLCYCKIYRSSNYSITTVMNTSTKWTHTLSQTYTLKSFEVCSSSILHDTCCASPTSLRSCLPPSMKAGADTALMVAPLQVNGAADV